MENLHQLFDRHNWWRFHKILRPSQNIWTSQKANFWKIISHFLNWIRAWSLTALVRKSLKIKIEMKFLALHFTSQCNGSIVTCNFSNKTREEWGPQQIIHQLVLFEIVHPHSNYILSVCILCNLICIQFNGYRFWNKTKNHSVTLSLQSNKGNFR